jgi:asparagine synthase (glutamine-hydrolysing)
VRYHLNADRLTFASEVRALLASGLVPKAIDPDGLYGYFRTGTVPEPRTLVKDVCCLAAGHYAVWKDGVLTPRRYWDLRFAESGTAAADYVATARAAMLDSVAHHFVSDRPVGIFLSGGVDSTALVALATRIGQRDLHTFSLAFPGLPNDESAIARRTAAHFGTTHAEWAVDAGTGRQLFNDFLAAADQPSIDGLNTFAVSKFASQRGMKVVLSGLGGDELFAGYRSFDEVPAMSAWNARLSHTGPLRVAAGRALERHASDPRWRRVGDLLQQDPSLANAYAAFRGVFTRSEAARLVEAYAGAAPSAAGEERDRSADDPSPRDAISRLEMTRYMRNQPLRDSDTMSMAWGLELRVPFLDGPLVDTLAGIPAGVRLQPRKRLLLQAVPEVPEWVASQPKRGFMFPFQEWLTGEWRDLFAPIDRTCPVPTETWYRKWCVFVFDRWARAASGGAGE